MFEGDKLSLFKRIGVIAILLLACGCETTILHELDEIRANQVLVTLANAQLDAEKSKDGAEWNIVVSSSNARKALKVLDQSRMLKRDLSRFSITSSSLIQTREERQHYVERQIAWNLETTLEALPGVLEARVHLFLQFEANLSFVKRKNKQSASVLLIAAPELEVSAENVKQIVSGASGVDLKDVNVVLTHMPKELSVSQVSLSSNSEPNDVEKLRGLSSLITIVDEHRALASGVGGGTLLGILVLAGRRKKPKISGTDSSSNDSNSDAGNAIQPGSTESTSGQPSSDANGLFQGLNVERF